MGKTKINSDIGGPGIRFAIWAQEIVLIIISIIGSFHNNATGVKEIGAGLGITHISLAIALLVEMTKKSEKGSPDRQLSAADAILGAMILDSQNMALSLPLVAKETLASRWQVGATVFCQAFGLVLLGVVTSLFSSGGFATNPASKSNRRYSDCEHISVAWWGWLNNGATDKAWSEVDTFWVYYACRVLIFLQSSFHSLYNTQKFHEAERYGTSLGDITFPAPVEKWSAWELLYRKLSSDTERKYEKHRTTVSLMYVVYGVFSLGSLAAAEKAFKSFKPQENDEFSVGQVIAVVVAGVTMLRGLWLLHRMYIYRNGRVTPQLRWPQWLKFWK
ncbi:hypothetical protein CTRI78_v011573 [Colletotrichum trifolii]|uniref:Uncharacterized protein n=1 Tax=Colletotrichum trifolii TaxID=5466 RepID=A0A4R8QBT2_COLTR|nr:hypothetical protein CTRI78_v011573 [Colletotrichum trifolii]